MPNDNDPGKPTAKVGSVVKADPVLRVSNSGKPFAKFSLAVKPYAPGEAQQETVYYEVTAFGSLAEHVAECIVKGDRVAVIGNGKVEEWTGNDGQTRYTKVILADAVGPDLRFCGADVHRGEKQPARQPRQEAAPALDDEPF